MDQILEELGGIGVLVLPREWVSDEELKLLLLLLKQEIRPRRIVHAPVRHRHRGATSSSVRTRGRPFHEMHDRVHRYGLVLEDPQNLSELARLEPSMGISQYP